MAQVSPVFLVKLRGLVGKFDEFVLWYVFM